MDYRLVLRASTASQWTQISEQEFNRLAEARIGILETLFIEEKFDLIMENFFEFEEEIISSAVRYLIFPYDVLEMIQESRLDITRRLANLLTTCRLYIDQSMHHISRVFGPNSSYEQEHKAAMSTEYDQHLSYRILEELRNYSQHRGYPFHTIVFSSSLVEPEPGADSVTVVIPRLSISELEGDGGFKPRVLAEISQAFDQDFDLRPHVMQYIDSLRIVQSHLRASLKDEIAGWKDAILGTASAHRDSIPEDEAIWSIELIAEDDEGEEHERLFFAFRSVDRLDRYARKNQEAGSLTRKFASSQVNPPSA